MFWLLKWLFIGVLIFGFVFVCSFFCDLKPEERKLLKQDTVTAIDQGNLSALERSLWQKLKIRFLEVRVVYWQKAKRWFRARLIESLDESKSQEEPMPISD